jgi:DNA-directed RNA polymerase specialized sigma24 family protein
VTVDPAGGDAELVAAALAEGDAFPALAARHRRRAGAIALAVLGDPGEAEDVGQEALLVAYTDLERLCDASRFGAWLRGIAANLARFRIRERRRTRSVSLEALAGASWPSRTQRPTVRSSLWSARKRCARR